MVAFVAGKPIERMFVSAVSLAEIRFGIECATEPGRRAELNNWLTHKVRPMFDQRILPFSEDIILAWRLLVEDGRKVGHTFSQPALMLAATALHYGLTLVSRNTNDFRLTPVVIFDPWTG